MEDCKIKPVIDQVEYHPHLTHVELRAFCEKEDIQFEAWSPLKRGQLLQDPTLAHIANKYEKSIAQVILRWNIQNNVVTIPKSVTDQRIKENANIFDFSLTDEDMEQINGMNINDRAGTNPDCYDQA